MTPVRMADPAGRHQEEAAHTEALVLEVVRSGRWIGGPLVEQAEAAAADVFGRKHAIGVASGTDALMLALQVAGVRTGDTVVVPALTFFATAGAVCALGARPYVVDVDARGLLALPDSLPPDTRALLPVHLFGNPCAVGPTDLPVVDDAAQAAGCETPSGDLTAVSTYPTKTWSGVGDGGFVLTADATLAAKVRSLGSHGHVGDHLHVPVDGEVGRNSRLDAVSAAMLLGQRRSLARRQARRRAIAARYDAELSDVLEPLERSEGNAVPTYCVRVTDRARLRAHLAERGIESAVYYPRPLHRQPALVEHLAGHEPTPVADRLCAEILALPVHAGLSDDEVTRVIQAVRQR